jgi:hypothetical protein
MSELARRTQKYVDAGSFTSSWLSADAVLHTAKRSDVVAYAVSVRSSLKPDFLRDLTSFTRSGELHTDRRRAGRLASGDVPSE